MDLGWYAAFWLLAVAGASASSVTIERERDTWVSLTATPLTGWEFVRGKLVGAMWNQRAVDAAPLSAKLLKNSKLKIYEKFPHGMCTTHADVVNPDLLAFMKIETARASAA